MERQIPKNVRQIGNVSDSSKIYVEDYVDTFFNQLCEKTDQGVKGAFLVGETVHKDEQDYIYVYGAIHMKDLEIKGKDFFITEEVWKHACKTCKEFFENAEILGWFLVGEEVPKEINHNIHKVHQKYFPREKSLFVTKSTRDKEEKFYIYKYRDMMECAGHFVYYEKNVEMQNYMIASRKKTGFTPSEIIEDRAAKNFRCVIQEKMDKKEKKSRSRFVYGMSTFLILIIVIIGVTMLNNYDKMNQIKESFDDVAQEAEKEQEEVVEALGGLVDSDVQETPYADAMQEEPAEETPNETPDETAEEIPEVSEEETTESTEPTHEVYIVQKGDTLETISREMYGSQSRIGEICELNGLEDGNLIFIGQKLLLP